MNTGSRTKTSRKNEELVLPFAAPAQLAAAPKRDKVSAWVRGIGVEGGVATRFSALLKGAEGTPAEKLRAAVGELVETSPFWANGEAEPAARVVAVVGPSGVGKTTTLAKLAARARIDGKTVALVSCDGFRVGAVDQLERYAELLSAELYVARSPVELAETLDDLMERPEGAPDVVFVDTSGRPPTNHSPEHALAGWIARAQKDAAADDRPSPTLEVLLCMAASTRANDAIRVVQIFAPVSPTGVVVTKTDETQAPSGLLHAPWAAKKPLVCICHGPRVPEDVTDASPDAVATHLESAEPMPGTTKKEGTS